VHCKPVPEPCHISTAVDSLLDSGKVFFSIEISFLWRMNIANLFHSVGFLTMVVPLYQAEICHPKIRGRVTALQQFMLGVGALCASWISYGTYIGFPSTNNAQWQLPLGIQMIPAVCLGLLIVVFPEVCINRFLA
jgi:MFS family permease